MGDPGESAFVAFSRHHVVEERHARRDTAGSLSGERGSRLMFVSRADGNVASELDLPVPPAWDALAIVPNRVVIRGIDHFLRCYGTK